MVENTLVETVFQRSIENVLRDVPGCCVPIDDILVSGDTDEAHFENLHAILRRLQECGLELNPDKCFFMLDEIVYQGTLISAARISPTKEKVQAIHNADPPTNVTELQSFLGSANFLRKFVPDFAKIVSPLYRLLRKERRWKWGNPEQDAFVNIKAALFLRFCITTL